MSERFGGLYIPSFTSQWAPFPLTMLPLPIRFSEIFLDTFSLQGCSEPVCFASLPHIRPLSLMFDSILMDMNGNLELCFNLFLYARFVNDIFYIRSINHFWSL